MSNTPPLNRILFVLYLLVTLVTGVAALIWPAVREVAYAPLRDALMPDFYLSTRAGAPVSLTVAAPPALQDWLKASAAEYSRHNSLVQINVVALSGLDASKTLNAITGQPDIWIADADFVRVAAGNIPYDAQGPSTAQNQMVWVALKTRSELSGNLNWKAVAQLSSQNPQFRIAMPPLNSIEGMAACWAASAEYHQTNQVSAAQISDSAFRTWLSSLLQAAPDRNRSPRDQLATRPPQGDAGFILNSDMQQLPQELFFSQPPSRAVRFNYPFYIRSSWLNVPADEAAARRAAAEHFRDYLLNNTPQNNLGSFGLERANTPLTGQLSPLDDSAVHALQFCWQ